MSGRNVAARTTILNGVILSEAKDLNVQCSRHLSPTNPIENPEIHLHSKTAPP